MRLDVTIVYSEKLSDWPGYRFSVVNYGTFVTLTRTLLNFLYLFCCFYLLLGVFRRLYTLKDKYNI